MKQASSAGLPGFQSEQSGQWRAAFLAALVHLLLLMFLWVGIRWQSSQPVAVEAEVWDLKTQDAAPLPLDAPAPEPEPVAAPVKPAPVVREEIPKEDPEIALRQAKQRQLEEKQKELQRLRDEQQQRQKAEQLEQQKLKEKEKLQHEKDLQRQKDLEKQKQLDRQKQAEQDKLDREKLDKKKLADQKAQQARDKAAADKVFKDQMQRLNAQAGSGGSGTAARSTGNNRGDPSYAAKIAAKIRSNTNFSGADSASGNPTVEFRIELLPGGLLRGPARKLKSSGNQAFDDAVAKGIEKSAPFPADKSGEYPTLDLIYKMKEE